MFFLFNIIICLFTLCYELEKKSSLVTCAFSAKSCTRDTDSHHSCTRLRLVQEMACLYHECKILLRKHSYPNLIPILCNALLSLCTCARSAVHDMIKTHTTRAHEFTSRAHDLHMKKMHHYSAGSEVYTKTRSYLSGIMVMAST